MKRFPNYKQLDSLDCGPTCLKIIAKHYGKSYNIEYLRNKSYISREGVSMLGISDAAESIGMHTRGVKMSFEQLVTEKPFPCILHWNQKHFVVCFGIKKNNKSFKINISDPIGEKYTINKDYFLKCWISQRIEGNDMGSALLLAPTPNFYAINESRDKKERDISYFISYLKPYKHEFAQLIIGLLIGSVLSLIFPFLTQVLVDKGINNHNLNLVTLILIVQLILFVTQLSVEFIRNWLTLHVNSRISISLISDFLSKLIKLPLRFFDTKNIGDIMQRIGDNNRIRSFLTSTTLISLFSYVNFIIFAIVLAYYNATILCIFILGNSLYIIWILLFLKYRRKLDINRFNQASIDQSNLVQLITGMQEIKLNNCEKQQIWKWEDIQVKLFKLNIKGLALGQYQQIGSIFFTQTTSIIISFMAAKSVIIGEMTLGMMMSISYIIGQLSGPIGQIISFVQSAQDAKISLERLNEVHNKEDEEYSITNKIDYLPRDRTITVKNLHFSYDGADRNYALKGINLSIPENKVTAIVGSSGSGKTTLLKLLLGFYLPNSGTIKVGERDLNDINPYFWRKKTSAVLQDSFIFSDTILNNIIVGEESINFEKLNKAVKMTNLDDFIDSLPLKFNTPIGMNGNGISQGQKQRILIARSIYKDPDYLFFDEATNSLDTNNERNILNYFSEFYKGRTVIIVAHRLSSVIEADNIIVLDKGEIIEEGTHDSLIKKKNAYYMLIKNQLELCS